MIKHAVIVAAIAALAGCASTTSPGAVDVDRRQLLIVPAEQLEQMAQVSFNEQNEKARAAGKLVTQGAEYERLRRIAARLQQQAPVFRPDAANWNWEVALIDSPELNASCAPGGKITVYTGIIRSLNLTDDEIAMVVGHEIAHALREHGREKVSQAMAQNLIGSVVLGALQTTETQAKMASQVADVMLTLPNSRKNESEADKIGLELAARAGFNPAAAVSVWQKMGAASSGDRPPQFLSTHPANESRIADLTRMQAAVAPLYQAASKQ
ncbi:M48 family metallopeptidase [Massilia polaris]|uniref:M48 family metallopeptidase n=1 Tax=Massilia polaris TaxID=2728846 RepID=UPI00280454B4|nr:M48 family metallopeptidase [Massilia polaris]